MFTLSDLPYDHAALEPFLDTQTMQIHHDKHHAAYVKNLNDALAGHDDLLSLEVDQLIRNLDEVPENIRTKVRNHGGGHANHSFFWMVMSPNPKGALREAQGQLALAINATFGSFEKFQELFSNAALGRFGSGWAWLVLKNGQLAITDTANQDSPFSQGLTPLLGLDVWEHAYYLKYQNRRAEYVKNWWFVINWPQVERLFSENLAA